MISKFKITEANVILYNEKYSDIVPIHFNEFISQ